MSEQEIDATIGRMVREQAEAARDLAFMKARLEMLHKGFETLANFLHYNVNPEAHLISVRKHLQVDPLNQYDFSKLVVFLEEYSAKAKLVSELAGKLRELGV